MPDVTQLAALAEQGRHHFETGEFAESLDLFRQAADGYSTLGDSLNKAEQMNNISVTLLAAGRPQEALAAVEGTPEIFAAHADLRRQGMALNNTAAALEGLRRRDAALVAYERAAQLLGEAGEGALRAEALKAAAALDLRSGRLGQVATKMLAALVSTPNPTLLERLLLAILRRIP